MNDAIRHSVAVIGALSLAACGGGYGSGAHGAAPPLIN